jgi:hypothetical protein
MLRCTICRYNLFLAVFYYLFLACAPSFWLIFAMKLTLFPGKWQGIIIGATEGESRSCTSLPQTPPAAPHTGHLQTENPGQETVTHTQCTSHLWPLTHSVSPVPHKSPFKIAKKNPAQPQLHGEWSVFSADQWMSSSWNTGLSSIPRAEGSGMECFLW